MGKRASQAFVVVGLGAFGATVALELARAGNHVLGIDLDEKRVNRFSNDLGETAIVDTTDELALREAGVDRYHCALVAIGEDLEASILTAMNMRLLGVPKIWAKAAHRTHHRILTKIGVDRVILPEHEMGRHVAQVLNNPALQDYVALGNGYSVASVTVPEWRNGQRARDLGLDNTLQLLGVMRGTEKLDHINPDLILHEDDRLLILGKRPNLQQLGDAL